MNETESLIKLHFVILHFFLFEKRKLRLLLIKVLKADIIVIHTLRVRNCSSGLALTLPTAPKSAYAFKNSAGEINIDMTASVQNFKHTFNLLSRNKQAF